MAKALIYILLVFTGLLLTFLSYTLKGAPPSQPGEYYLSSILRNGYTLLTAFLFFFTSFAIGYGVPLNPWLTGICLVLAFPLASIYEAAAYRGSHNLIPFELAIHFIYALPAVIGTYAGKLVQRSRKNGKGDNL
jgi:hypothetical protein